MFKFRFSYIKLISSAYGKIQLFFAQIHDSSHGQLVVDVRFDAYPIKLCPILYIQSPNLLQYTDSWWETFKRNAHVSNCQSSSFVKMTPNIFIEHTVLLVLPLTRSLHVGSIEAAAAFRQDGAITIDKYLLGLRPDYIHN